MRAYKRIGVVALLVVFVFMIYVTPIDDVEWVTTAKDVVHLFVWGVGVVTLARLFFRWSEELQGGPK